MSIDVNPVQEPIIEENTKVQDDIAYTRAFLRGPDAGWESGTAHIKAQVYDTLIVELANIKDELADQRIISDNWKARAECAQREIDLFKEQEPFGWKNFRFDHVIFGETCPIYPIDGWEPVYIAAGAQIAQQETMKATDFPVIKELQAAAKDKLKFFNQMVESKIAAEAVAQPVHQEPVHKVFGTIGHIGYGKATLGAAISTLLPAVQQESIGVNITTVLDDWEKWAFSTSLDERNHDLCKALKEIRSAAQSVARTMSFPGIDVDGMVEAFHRVIEAHNSKDSPFQDPINRDARTALRVLRGMISVMKSSQAQEQHKLMNPTDIKIEVLYDGGGFSPISDKGIRITHIPTGCVFESVSERSQHANREKAFQELNQYFGIKDSTYQEKN